MIDVSQTVNLMVNEVRDRSPKLPDEKVCELIHLIVSTNFPKCLEKYINGDDWKL